MIIITYLFVRLVQEKKKATEQVLNPDYERTTSSLLSLNAPKDTHPNGIGSENEEFNMLRARVEELSLQFSLQHKQVLANLQRLLREVNLQDEHYWTSFAKKINKRKTTHYNLHFYISATEIEYRAGKIYYGNQQVTSPAGNYFLMSANEDGTGTTQLYSTALPIYNIATSSTTLYWTEYNSTSPATSYLKSMPIAGGTVTTMATSTTSSFYDLYADETNSQLYFVEAITEARTYNLLRKMPIAGGAASTVYVSESQLYSFTLASSVALPVTFIQVDAQLKGAAVDVKWDVAAEQNVREYSVQKSRNGMNFQETGTVPAEGKPIYRFTDKSPFTGKSYYRILAIDHDEKKTYSRIIPVDMQITSLKIYPTIMRSGEALSLSVTTKSDMQMDVQVYSMSGSPVYKGKVTITKGDNQFKMTLPNMVSGQYLVRLSGGGETIYTASLSVL